MRVLSAVAVFAAVAAAVADECVRLDALNEAREEIMEELANSKSGMAQITILLDRLEGKVDRLTQSAKEGSVGYTSVSPATVNSFDNDGVEGRLRSLEGSVSSLQRKFNEKLDESLGRVVDVENKREQQEKIFTDILKKILNTVNTVYERIHAGVGETKPKAGPPGVQRAPPELQQIALLQDSLESLSRDFREKLDILENKLSDSINDLNLHTRIASDKVNYISENMVLNEDVQRIGENNPKIIDTDRVLEAVKEGMTRCTRAFVNSQNTGIIVDDSAATRSISPAEGQPPTTTAIPELAFYVGPTRDDCKMTAAIKVPHNCDQLGRAGANCDGPYMVYDNNGKKPMKVVCDMTNGRWTILLRRGNVKDKPLSFDRAWSSYKHGFGSLENEMYIGNEHIHKLTEIPKQLRIELEAFSGETLTLDYANFTVGPESDNYRMTVGPYMGNNPRIGNAFRRHNDKQFSTKDRLQSNSSNQMCPVDHKAGHWWHSCYSVLLTGEYATPQTATAKNGIRWSAWKAEPLKAVTMKIRDMS